MVIHNDNCAVNTARRQNGFTLLELLTAVAITLVLAAVMLSIVTAVLEGWRRAQDRFTTDSEATLVFDYLERDLGSALFRSDGQTWMALDLSDDTLAAHGWVVAAQMKPAAVDTVPIVAGRPELMQARFGRSGIWLRLFTSDAPSMSDRTLPVAVGYQIVRRQLSSANQDAATARYGLYRRVVGSEEVFSVGYDVHRHAAALTPARTEDLLATNVIDFGVWLHRRELDGRLTRLFPATASDRGFAIDSMADQPDIADIVLRILTEEGATRISALEQGREIVPAGVDPDTWWWQTAERSSHVYVHRIELRSTGGVLP